MKDILAGYEEYLRSELSRSSHTVRAYMKDVEAFGRWLSGDGSGTRDIRSAAMTDVRAWLASLSRSGLKATTIRRRLQSLRAFYRYLMRKRLFTRNPAADVVPVRIPVKLPQFIKPEDIEALLSKTRSGVEGCPAEEHSDRDGENTASGLSAKNPEKEVEEIRDRLIIEILYVTGIRRSELLGIHDSDIDRTRGEVKVLGKRHKERIIPLAPQMLEHIAEWQRLRDKTWPAEGDRPLLATNRGRMSEATLYRIVHRGLEEVNTGRKSPHTLRHTFATAMLNQGANLTDVKEFLGHSSLSTTQIYTHVSFSDLMKAYDNAHPRSKEKS